MRKLEDLDVDLEEGGLPPLADEDSWSWFEFLPLWFFYLPVVVYWILLGIRYRSLGLPLLANPNIDLGGMIGESKSEVLNQAGAYARSKILPFVTLEYRGDAIEEAGLALVHAKKQNINLPLVVKPDLGCRGLAVRVVTSQHELQHYLARFPINQKYLLQKLAPWSAEAGVFYVRKPGERKGTVDSLTLKYLPKVVGDGVKTFAELLDQNPRSRKLKSMYLKKNTVKSDYVPEKDEPVQLTFAGSHCRGSIFRNGNQFICKKMTDAIDKVMQDFPEFYYGRLDLKFRDLKALQAGEDFCVIEINGASSEATHIWDSRTRIREVFTTLFWQYRSLFEIGARLRAEGRRPPSAMNLLKVWLRSLKGSASYPQGQ